MLISEFSLILEVILIVQSVGKINIGVLQEFMVVQREKNKCFTCELVRKHHNSDELAWLVGGDLNAMFWRSEQKSEFIIYNRNMDWLLEVVCDSNLNDLGYMGKFFTWSNK